MTFPAVLLDNWDYIITVGTDILFTDFNKDIRTFLSGAPVTIQIQDNRPNATVNGDFIIWKYNKECFHAFSLQDCKYRNSQEAVNKLRYTDWKDCMRILPCRTLQSVMETPFMPPRSRQRPQSFWKEGDFSAHAHAPQISPKVDYKQAAMEWFLKEHPSIT